MARGVNGLVERAWLTRCEVSTLRLKANQTAAATILNVIGNLGRQHDRRILGSMGTAGSVLDLCTGLQALSRLDQAFPYVTQRINVLAALEQKRLHHAAGLGFTAHQTRRHHTSLVDDQQIARLDVVDDVAEDTTLDRTAVLQCHGIGRVTPLAVKHEQTARIARLGRRLSDKLFGQVVIKIIGTHGHDRHPLLVKVR